MCYHRTALLVFMVVVLGHWAEHVVQLGQIYLLHWPRAKALGLLGLAYPGLVRSESLHFGYAVLMVLGLIALRYGFTGRALRWWSAALLLQYWHGFEHLLLFSQVQLGFRLVHCGLVFNMPDIVPAQSIVQLLLPGGLRPELHLFYNLVVTVPMTVATCIYMLRRGHVKRSRSW
jgi:hypothetical protein